MGIYKNDLRAALQERERLDELRLVAEAAAERQRLSDQVAAAALTSLLAYEVADAMLRAGQQGVPTDG